MSQAAGLAMSTRRQHIDEDDLVLEGPDALTVGVKLKKQWHLQTTIMLKVFTAFLLPEVDIVLM